MTSIIHSIKSKELPPELKCRTWSDDSGSDTYAFFVRTSGGIDVSIFFATEEQFLAFCQENNLPYINDRPVAKQSETAE